jgi:hypothetical protein
MTDLPTPAKESYGAGPKPTAYYTADQLRDYGRAEYLRALNQIEQMDWVDIMREGQLVTWGDAATLGYRVVDACRALAGEKT